MQKVLMFSLLLITFLGVSCVQTEAKIENKKINLEPLSPKIEEAIEKIDLKELSPEGQKAYDNLLKAARFEQGAVGVAGTVSRYVESLNVLLKEKSADAAFKSLLSEATTAGKLYALCGLYFTDYESFQNEVGKYAKSEESIETMSGCEIFSEKVGKLVELKDEKVAIIKPSQTLEDFSKTHKDGFEVDIAHGGFPAIFKRFANIKK